MNILQTLKYVMLCMMLFVPQACAFDLFGGKTEKEVRDARGSTSALDVRLDEATNEDGSLKGSITMSEWISGYNATRTATNQFTVLGDRTAVYRRGRQVYLNGCDNEITITGSSYVIDTSYIAATPSSVCMDLTRADYSVVSLQSAPPPLDLTSSAPTIDLFTGRLYRTNRGEFQFYNNGWNEIKTSRDGVFNALYYATGSATDGIQEAINAANTAGGGTVWLSVGDYTIGAAVTLYSNITLKGSGFGTVINSATDLDLDLEGATSSPYGLSALSVGDYQIDFDTTAQVNNLSVDDLVYIYDDAGDQTFYIVESIGASEGTATLDSPIMLNYSDPTINVMTPKTNVNVRDITFSNVDLHFNYVSDITVEDCKFTGTGSMLSSYGYRLKVVNNTFIDSPVAAIILTYGQDSMVLNNHVYNSGDDAIRFYRGFKSVIQGNNIYDAGAMGIEMENSFSVVSNNNIYGVLDDAIWLGSFSDSNSVVGNVCLGGVIDNDGGSNVGAGNVYLTCEGCTW